MKNSILRILLLITVVAFSVAVSSTPASAQYYFGFKGGIFQPNKPNTAEDRGSATPETGIVGEIFTGYRFIPYFGLEGGAGYYHTSYYGTTYIEPGYNDTMSAIPLTLTAKGFLPLGEKAHLYAGGGAGVYFAEYEKESLPASEGDDVVFGYHAVVGGEFMVSKRFGLQAEAKWLKVDLVGQTDISGVMYSFGVLFHP